MAEERDRGIPQFGPQKISEFQRVYIGQGMKFPVEFNKQKGGTEKSSELFRINQSIFLILSTNLRSRVMQPDFGSRIPELLFETIDEVLIAKAKIYTAEALRKWEPRVEILEVDVDPTADERNNNLFPIAITYQLIGSNLRNNYVFPFKREPRPMLGAS